ncbi:MAG: hypothetical protein Ct9H300mP27_00940 [Chloroflexota bacterium]|nr:MAG: hypothetical protein Ct9H300mP27_00940 [Chloroflexota bacterium]
MVELGSGQFIYEVLKAGALYLMDGVSKKWQPLEQMLRVTLCFQQGDHPMIVFDKDGNFLRSWGGGVFLGPTV